MANRGFAVRTFDLPKWDFTRPADRRAFLRLMHEERPHVVWFAPPCPKWSPLQNLTARGQNQQELLDVERQSQHASHLKLTRRGFEHQYSTGGIAVVEHPKPSLAWRTPAFRDMPGWAAILDQCAVGAKLPNQYGRLTPIKKATRLQVTHKVLFDMLSLRCPGHSLHLPLVGHSPRIGSRSAAAAEYQPQMCRKIADALQTAIAQALTTSDPTDSAFAGMPASSSNEAPAPAPNADAPQEPNGVDEPPLAPDSPAAELYLLVSSLPLILTAIPVFWSACLSNDLRKRKESWPAYIGISATRVPNNFANSFDRAGPLMSFYKLPAVMCAPPAPNLHRPIRLPRARFAVPLPLTSVSWLTLFGLLFLVAVRCLFCPC